MASKKQIETREDIIKLVDTFYLRVLEDKTIGFIFTKVANINLKEHMPKMYDFWETTLFHNSKYKGNPIKIHLDLHEKHRLTETHFEVWLKLFVAVVDELFQGTKAELAKTRALSIATIMQIKIAQHIKYN